MSRSPVRFRQLAPKTLEIDFFRAFLFLIFHKLIRTNQSIYNFGQCLGSKWALSFYFSVIFYQRRRSFDREVIELVSKGSEDYVTK